MDKKDYVSHYKKQTLAALRSLWQSDNADIWCKIWTMVKFWSECEAEVPAK